MKIQLKSGSSIRIVNHNGNEIIEVHEDGTIDGVGGLYRHEITTDENITIILIDNVSSPYTSITTSLINNMNEFGCLIKNLSNGQGRLFNVRNNSSGMEVEYYDSADAGMNMEAITGIDDDNVVAL